MRSGTINANDIKGGLGGQSKAQMGELFTHDALPALLPNFPVDKSQDAVVHVHRPLPLHQPTLTLLQAHGQTELAAGIILLEV